MATQYAARYLISDRGMSLFLLFSLVCTFGFAANLAASVRIDQGRGNHGKIEADHHSARLSFHESIERYGKTEAGAQLFAELSALEGIQDSPLYNQSFDSDDDDDDEDSDSAPEIPLTDAPKPKSTNAMLKQLNEFSTAHPRIVSLIPKLRDAVHKVFDDPQHDTHAGASRMYSQNSEKYSDASPMYSKESAEDEKKKDAVVLENVLQVLKNLPEEQAALARKDKKFLTKKLVRGDLEMDDKEFQRTHFGLKHNKDEEWLTEIPVLDLDTFEEEASLLQDGAQSSSTNPRACHPKADVCDRRQIDGSCEQKLKVEAQGSCGSCWAFAGTHYLALSHCVATGIAINYSEQELLDCSGSACSGASFDTIYNYLSRNNHLSAEADYTYEARQNYCMSNGKRNVWTGDYHMTKQHKGRMSKFSTGATDKKWIETIKENVSIYGAVVYSLNANMLRFQNGVAVMCDSPMSTNHATVITGWTKKNGRPVWIMRNSWGDWWHDSGYGYIAMDTPCQEGLDPIAVIQAIPIRKWSDQASKGPDLIVTQTEKQKGIEKGEAGTITCTSGVINVKSAVVVSTGRLMYEKPTNINVAGACNGRTSCQIYHPPGGYRGFDTLRILYECKGENPSPSPSPTQTPSPSPTQRPSPSPTPNPGPNSDPNPAPYPDPSYCQRIKPSPKAPHVGTWCVMACNHYAPWCSTRPDMVSCLDGYLSEYCDSSEMKIS